MSWASDLKIEGFTLSVGASQALDISLRNNKKHLDFITVATTPSDINTQQVCKKNKVRCIVTDAFYNNGKKFDKGLVRNILFASSVLKEWFLYFDPDIIFHHRLREYLSFYPLHIDCLYGAERFCITKIADVENMMLDQYLGPPGNEWGFGFFQLFNPRSKWLQERKAFVPNVVGNLPLGIEDFYFRRQFGDNHYFSHGFWSFDSRYQRCLTLPVFHLGHGGHYARSINAFYQKHVF